MANLNWGSVPDWLTLAVTLGTAIFLYLTFREQLKINKATLNKHKREIRPFFKVVDEIDDENPLRYDSYAVLTNAMALECKAIRYDPDGKEDTIEFNHPHVKLNQRFFINIHTRDYHYDYKGLNIKMWDITFKDEEGRQYRQSTMLGKHNIPYITFPQLLKDIV